MVLVHCSSACPSRSRSARDEHPRCLAQHSRAATALPDRRRRPLVSRRTAASSRCKLAGFAMNGTPAGASAGSAPDITSTGRELQRSIDRKRRISSHPLITGISRSSKTRSGSSALFKRSSASLPSFAAWTTYPSASREEHTRSRRSSSSSTTSTLHRAGARGSSAGASTPTSGCKSDAARSRHACVTSRTSCTRRAAH